MMGNQSNEPCRLTDFLPTTRKEVELRGWDEVDVVLKKSMGMKAVWISYVIPLFILMILILSLSSVTVHEVYVGLGAIASVLFG